MKESYLITIEKTGEHWTASATLGGRVFIAEGETLKQAHDGVFILISERVAA